MRVLLVNPKMASGWKPYAVPPIGLCSLKAAVESTTKHKVKVLDASGMPLGLVKVEIETYKPDVVGITTFTEARHNALAVAKLGHEFGAGVILGGAHATHTSKQILTNYPFVDAVCRGEGEQAFPYWLDNFTEDPSFQVIKNLDELPLPDYSDLDLSRYIDALEKRGQQLCAIETSRGCPYNCTFCSSKLMWGNIRFKSVSRVLRELEVLVSENTFGIVSFVDDIFTINKKRTKELCSGLEDFQLSWRCQTRTDCVDRETLEAMKQAGCKFIAFGVESGAASILESMNKNESKVDIRNAFNLCRQVGIKSIFNIIVGNPGETASTLKETRDLVRECRPYGIGTAALRAYPGSGIWELGIKQGLFTEDALLDKRESIHYEGALSLNQMYRELIKFRFLQARLRGVRGWIELLRLGFETLRDTPYKILRGVLR